MGLLPVILFSGKSAQAAVVLVALILDCSDTLVYPRSLKNSYRVRKINRGR